MCKRDYIVLNEQLDWSRLRLITAPQGIFGGIRGAQKRLHSSKRAARLVETPPGHSPAGNFWGYQRVRKTGYIVLNEQLDCSRLRLITAPQEILGELEGCTKEVT